MSTIERQASILQVATDSKNQGRKSDDKQSFVNSYFVSISNGIELKNKSVNKITKHLYLPRSTRYRLFGKCDEIRKDLVNKKGNVKWSSVSKRRKRYPLISDSLKILIQNWIIKHPSVVASPIAKDTILVRDMITGNKDRRVGKYLIQIYIRELHNDLIKSKNEGGLDEVWNGKKLLVSDTGLRYMIPINVKKFTPRYNQICECVVCIQAKQLQRSLNAWRNRNSIDNPAYRRVVMPNDMTLHSKPRDAIQNMLCPYTSLGKLY